ncbi:sel1 repeat family protein, partial [Pseudomonas aeruginosa]|nr:sel1 repeat family protein [Pseudomonas aeruginosa]
SGHRGTGPAGGHHARHWAQAAEAGHPLAARKLAELYRDGGPGLAPDSERAEHYAQRASALGL